MGKDKLQMNKKCNRFRKRLFEIVEVGNDLDRVSRFYDFLSVIFIVLNLTVSIMHTFSNININIKQANCQVNICLLIFILKK